MANSTQPVSSQFSIPFALSHNQQSFRFLELPDELVNLIAAGSGPRLQLKSEKESASTNGNAPHLTPGSKSSEYVHVCCDELEKSWSVRQVSTSNEVYVVQAVPAGRGGATNEDTDVAGNGAEQCPTVLSAIAKTDSILELLPTSVDIQTHLRKLLPTYNRDQLTRVFEKSGGPLRLNTKGENEYLRVASQIPAPDTSIRKIWRQLCVSSCPGTSANLEGNYFIPTVQLLKTAWDSSYSSYCIRTGGKGSMEEVDFADDGEDADDLATVKASLWTCLCSDDGLSLDREKVVSWVGNTLWQSTWTSASQELAETKTCYEFEGLWRDLLPRAWADEAIVNKLEAGTYELFTEGGQAMLRWTGAIEPTDAPKFTGAKPGKRKWHEKFRDSRNVKT